MKNRKAYENTLSIILDEPDIKMEEVKVEEVILNRYGKRAIRLDAWGKTVDNRQINMEMENNMKLSVHEMLFKMHLERQIITGLSMTSKIFSVSCANRARRSRRQC